MQQEDQNTAYMWSEFHSGFSALKQPYWPHHLLNKHHLLLRPVNWNLLWVLPASLSSSTEGVSCCSASLELHHRQACWWFPCVDSGQLVASGISQSLQWRLSTAMSSTIDYSWLESSLTGAIQAVTGLSKHPGLLMVLPCPFFVVQIRHLPTANSWPSILTLTLWVPCIEVAFMKIGLLEKSWFKCSELMRSWKKEPL